MENTFVRTENAAPITQKADKAGYRGVYSRVVKRMLDIVLALIGTVIVTPVILIIGIFLVLEDGFPVFTRRCGAAITGSPFISSSCAPCTGTRINTAALPR